MKLVADEGIDRQIVEALRASGIEVTYIAEMEPGVSDDVVLGLARDRSSLLLTADKDFGELVFRQRRTNAGVVLLRLSGLSADAKASIVGATFAAHAPEMLGAFTVISPGIIRIRSKQQGR